jgi:predicted dithiol-disulfide oxidoreductase (DUF899 family)
MESYDSGPIRDHAVVTHEEWLRARVALLEKEKGFSRQRDELARARRALPWERVEKTYTFETPSGVRTLADLFEGRRQLVVYHFMFAPGAKQGCPGCSFFADSFDVLAVHAEHLHQRDTTFVAVSRAPLTTLEAYKQRMGWHFNWVSSGDSDFNYDLYVSFRAGEREAKSGFYNYRVGEEGQDREGASAFYRDESGVVFHTYSTYARGIDLLNMTYNVLDLTAKGRDEEHLGEPMEWVRHHDRYPTMSRPAEVPASQ